MSWSLKKITRKQLIGIGLVAFGIALLAATHHRSKYRSVRSVAIKRGDLSSAIYGSAQLKTDLSFELKLGTVARISTILKSVGQRVTRGETLLVFDNLPPFRAPLDGTITSLNFRNGETVFAQTTVLSIVEPKNFYLEMSLDQKSIRFVRAAQTARISFEGYRDLKLEGKVRSTFSNAGLFYAVIDLPQAEPNFLPGMSADVAIVTETRRNVLLAPLGSLKDGKILVERKGQSGEFPVAVGPNDGDLAEVVSESLNVGDLAIIRSSLPTGPGDQP